MPLSYDKPRSKLFFKPRSNCQQGVVDLVKMKAIVWNGEELGAKFEEQDIPADLAELAQEYREKLIEGVVEQDDAVRRGDLCVWGVFGLWLGAKGGGRS